MLRVAVLALGATLTIGAFAPKQAAAQSGRQRSEGRGGVYYPQNGGNYPVYSDTRCYDQNGVYDRRGRDDDDQYDRYDGGRDSKEWKRERKEQEKARKECEKQREQWDRQQRRNDQDRDDGYYSRNGDYNSNRGNGNGPQFCRNGQGHPVFGMAWCRQKGYGDSNYGVLRNTGWGDVILRRPRYGAQGDLRYSILQQILGSRVLNRFNAQRAEMGIDAPLYGRWLETPSGSVLDLFAGNLQIGQILDRNRDGRADVVLMRSR